MVYTPGPLKLKVGFARAELAGCTEGPPLKLQFWGLVEVTAQLNTLVRLHPGVLEVFVGVILTGAHAVA